MTCLPMRCSVTGSEEGRVDRATYNPQPGLAGQHTIHNELPANAVLCHRKYLRRITQPPLLLKHSPLSSLVPRTPPIPPYPCCAHSTHAAASSDAASTVVDAASAVADAASSVADTAASPDTAAPRSNTAAPSSETAAAAADTASAAADNEGRDANDPGSRSGYAVKVSYGSRSWS
ncbi:unnamed protein product [Closterium sp. NIES-54]